jgi:Zn-dependent protease with chaperone function
VSAWHLIVTVLGHHLIPCVLASGVMYLALSLLFGPFRLRRPADRVLFLYAALVKAGLALWVGEKVSCLASYSEAHGTIGFCLPDLIPDGIVLETQTLAAIMSGSHFADRVLVALVVAGAALLCYRWARLAPFYRSIYEQHAAEPRAAERLARTFESLVDRAHGRFSLLARPRLLVIGGVPGAAFTMGVRPSVVVVSAELVEKLGERELRGVLAHEIAHVRRLDYVGRWLAAILLDIMIWNPFAWLWYQRLVREQEMAADEYAAELVHDPAGVASGLVEVAAYAKGLSTVSLGPLHAWGGGTDQQRLTERVDRLVARQLLDRMRPSAHAPLVYLLLGAFFAAQPHVAVSVPYVYGLALAMA